MRGLLTWLAVMKTVLIVFATPSVAEPSVYPAMQFLRIPVSAGLAPATALPHLPTLHEIETTCLAAALYHEARGESRPGQLAVARVILNRMRSHAYPDTICGVVYQGAEKPFRCQFSFACDDLPDAPRNLRVFQRLHALVHVILEHGMPGRLLPGDPHEYREADFDQITHYHADYVSPFWGKKIDRVGQIGRHVFYRSERVARSL
jgi:N-acetylmuramoyl-L-alanine amidase